LAIDDPAIAQRVIGVGVDEIHRRFAGADWRSPGA
jgi:hypothetical protein